MSKFFPGALARVISGADEFGRAFVGQVVRVVRPEVNCGFSGWVVDRQIAIGELFYREWELEPVRPEGAAPSEYSYTELMDRLKAGEGVPA